MKYLVNIFRFIVGGIFIFSGFVKADDPKGTAFKLEEYFSPAVFDIPIFEEYSLILACIFIFLEIILGVMLVIGYRVKFTVSMIVIIMIFFTFLTGYSYYKNAVQDCGCFGDFIKFTPKESYYKDIVLLIMSLFLVYGMSYIKPLFKKKTSLIILGIVSAITVYVMYVGINKLPIFDFRPFAVGSDIKKETTPIQEEEKITYYQLKSKTGRADTLVDSKAYAAENGLWKDSLNWAYDDSFTPKDSIITPEIPAPIKNFEVEDAEGISLKEEILDAPAIMLIVYNDESDYCTEGEYDISRLVDELKAQMPDLQYLAIASSPNFRKDIPSAILDDSTMKQMIRSNPGILFLKNGIVVGKYPYNDLPTVAEVENLY